MSRHSPSSRRLAPLVLVVMALCFCLRQSSLAAVDDDTREPTSPLRSVSGPQTIRDILPPPLAEERLPRLASARGDKRGEFAEEDRDRVNVSRAMAFSFLFPGAGQMYAGARRRGGVFLAGDAITWTAFIYFRTVSTLKKDDYISYARVHAGIDPGGKTDEFYRYITFYSSRDEYNDAGRLVAPGRPYYPDTSLWDWQWDRPASMSRYRTLRNQSSEASNRAKFALAIAVVHRLAAAVDAWRTAKSANRRARMESSHWQIHLKGRADVEHPRLAIAFSKRF